LINVYLDSPNINPSNRGRQVPIAASLLCAIGLHCGVVASDFNTVADKNAFFMAGNGL